MQNKTPALPHLADIRHKKVNELSIGEIKLLYRFVLSCERLISFSVKLKNIKPDR
ncbi:MAG: hypothetical protein WCK11_05500 [Candidatus Falkowbacteria bacterium]